MPQGTTHIQVYPENPPGGLQVCTLPLPGVTLSTPTTGTVTAASG